jgi:hypothetical protein
MLCRVRDGKPHPTPNLSHTLRKIPIPILELTPPSSQTKSPFLFLHLPGTYFATPLFSSSSMEWGVRYPSVVCLLVSSPTTYPLSLHILAHSPALFLHPQKLNSFIFKRFRTLCTKTLWRGGGVRLGLRRKTNKNRRCQEEPDSARGADGVIHVGVDFFAGGAVALVALLEVLKVALENELANLA